MSEPGKSRADAAATIALFVVILLVSVVLAVVSDLNAVARGVVAVAAGIVAAGVTFALVNRRRNAGRD
ncbi:hypothetical protein GC089_13380 [Cellulomonas sp. JZ18]|uniref:hypothetical protein n=1 Tax=Cellulomonas sp. JZ18 TaxID=2654191 RepID=UPI0012D3E85A|nr:hypothetical protein [Cellulomonas sp. JZ18]QGQ20017.1 hypothetical protein GC089_13380 [Cellulomonas sp. JZ18]